MVIGDTGEGDRSQYSVVPAFLNAAEGTRVRRDRERRRLPRRRRQRVRRQVLHPVRRLPAADLRDPRQSRLARRAGRVHAPLLRRGAAGAQVPPAAPRPMVAARARASRCLLAAPACARHPDACRRGEELRGEAQASGPAQPNMYFCIDTPELRDHRDRRRDPRPARLTSRASGCRRVSAGPKPKLLISGKPVYAGAEHEPAPNPRRRTAARSSRAAVVARARSRQQLRGDDRRRRPPLRAPQCAGRRRARDPVR